MKEDSRQQTRVMKVVVYGLESTGKTMLTEFLSKKFEEPWSAEYVREFWEENAGRIVGEDLGIIAHGQITNEEMAIAKARRVVFCDTDLLTCTLWDDLLFPEKCPQWVREEAEKRAREVDLYLLCHPDVPYVMDDLRSDGTCFPDPEDRKRLMALWTATLETRGLPYAKICGDWAEREQRAEEAIRTLLLRGE